MALYDNPLWILSHIRNSFVVSDDTGNSELVMAADKYPECLETIAKQEAVEPFLKLEETEADDEFRPKSLEIRLGTNPVGYRPRCNTEIKLEKMKRERKNAPNIRTISWRHPTSDLSQDELDKLFPRKAPTPLESIVKRNAEPQSSSNVPKHKVSLFSQQLNSCKDVDSNSFSSYSQFAGGDSEEDSKSLQVFLSMCQKLEDGSLPHIKTKVKSNAKVIEVIGYLCYVYTKQNRQPPLLPNVDVYMLYLADEGTVEWDLPNLEHHELISRYGFGNLALVENKSSNIVKEYSIKITLPDGTFTVVQLLSKNISLQELIDKAMSKRRKLAQVEKFKFLYNIERTDTPGVALDPNAMLSGIDSSEFFIVRQNSRRYSDHIQIEIDDCHSMSAVEASAYKEYVNLKLLTRLRTKLPVICAISEDKIEIIPHQAYGSSLQMWSAKIQSRLIKFEDVVACQLSEKVESSLLCVIYRHEQNYAKLRLECDDDRVSKEICAKVKYLINERSSEIVQSEYKAYRERKIHRRKTIHF